MNDYTLLDDLCTAWRYPGGEVGVRATAPFVPPTAVLARIQDSDALVKLLMYLATTGGAVQKVCVPYLPYARQDRVATPGDPIAIDVLAQMLATSGIRRFATLEAHSPASIAAFTAAGCELTNLPATPWIARFLATLKLRDDRPLWFVAPDKGARPRTEAHAQVLATTARPIGVIHCTKVRDPITGKLTHFEVDPQNRPNELGEHAAVVVVDDICDGGGTFLGVAKALRQTFGNHDLHLWTTHGIYSRGLADLTNSFSTLGSTDSFLHGRAHERLITIPLQTQDSPR